MRKRGFTLVELLAVIAIISIIMVISLPELLGQLKISKQDSLEKTKEIIISAARNYVIDYKIPIPASISIETLCNNNYIDCPVKNPVDDTVLSGYIIANTKSNYTYFNSSTPKQITNMIINGSFENGTIGWSIAGINLSLSNLYSKFDNYSIQNYHSNQYNSLMSDAIPVIVGHKYYVGSYSYTVNKGNGCMYSDLNIIYDSASHWLGVEGCQENLNKWELLSEIKQVPNVNSPTLSIAIATTTSTNNLQEGYGDGAFIIDLTETFGVGNEPTKEWCDENIDYFDGTQTIYVGS